MKKDIVLFSSNYSDKKKEQFYSDLHTLIDAGMDIKVALEMIEADQTNKKDKALIQSIKEQVIGGTSFSETLRKEKAFSAYEYNSIKIGEESGELIRILDEMAGYFNKKVLLKKQIVSVVTYPIIVIVVAIGIMLFMINFLIPSFAGIIKQMGGDLPYLTKVMIRFSDAIGEIMLIGAATMIAMFLFYQTQKRKIWFRKYTSTVVLNIPYVKGLVHKIYLARFATALSLLISTKVDIISSLKLLKNMIDFYPIESIIDSLEPRLIQGESLNQAMSAYKIFPKRFLSLVKVGEEVNRLDGMFKRLGDGYAKEVEEQAGLLGEIIQPLLMLVIGLFIGIIVIAMYLPMFEMAGNFGM